MPLSTYFSSLSSRDLRARIRSCKLLSPALWSAILISLIQSIPAVAVPGTLDPAFGAGGRVVTNVSSVPDQSAATFVLRTADSKIVTGGLCVQSGRQDLCISRRLPNGSPDPTFGVGGVVVLPSTTATYYWYAMNAVLVGDAVVLAARCRGSADACLYKLTPTGTLDQAFGINGVVTTVTRPNGPVYAIALQGNKIVVAGGCYNQDVSAFYSSLCIARFSANGAIDMTFNGTGIAITQIGLMGNTDKARVRSLAIDGNMIVAAGICYVRSAIADFCVARYLDNGSLDATFAASGYATMQVSAGNHFASAVSVDSGKVTLIGSCNTSVNINDPTYGTCLARWNQDGTPDPTFGSNGSVRTDMGPVSFSVSGGFIAQSQIWVTGSCGTGTTVSICAMRYLPSGAVDSAFGTVGIVTLGRTGTSLFADASVADANGALIAGQCGIYDQGNLCVVRLTDSGALDAGFVASGFMELPLARSGLNETGSSIALRSDGKYIVGGACAIASGAVHACLVRYQSNGAPDTTLNQTGSVISPLGLGDSSINALVDVGGKTLAVGNCMRSAIVGVETCAIRYNQDGTLDTTFGTNGIAGLPAAFSTNVVRAAAIDGGKLVVAGTCGASPTVFCVARLNVDGSPDATFNGSGFVQTGIGIASARIVGVAVASGKIIVGGTCDVGGLYWYRNNFCLVRYTQDGQLDNSFGTAGVTNGPSAFYNEAQSMAVDGTHIILSGRCTMDWWMCAARYSIDGVTDTSFGTNGIFQSGLMQGAGVSMVQVALYDNRVVLAAECRATNLTYTQCFTRLTPGGIVDNSLGTRGKLVATYAFGNAHLSAAIVDGSRLIAVGTCNNTHDSDICLTAVDLSAATPSPPIIDAIGPGDGIAYVGFVPSASDGGKDITAYTATCNPGNISASGQASPIVVPGVTNGTTYSCQVTATNAVGTSNPSGSLSVTPSAAAIIALAKVFSRKQHSITGTFDILINKDTPIWDAVTIELRQIGSGHNVVFRFFTDVTSVVDAVAVDANMAPVGTRIFSVNGNEVTVVLTNVPNNQRVKVMLSGVNGSLPFEASLGYLVGDVNGSGAVNAADISALKARQNQTVDSTNFQYDLDASGIIYNESAIAKSRSGLKLP